MRSKRPATSEVRDGACEPAGTGDQARLLSKVRSFRCAPWKRVRIFEGIIGIFQDAHFSKTVRTFEPRAHLRSRALALHPVPFSRKVVQALASASIALCCVGKNVIDKLAESDNRLSLGSGAYSELTRLANKKSHAWIF
jgi:hypothetical protein